MKTNKKAILGMLVAIVMSLGVMQGISAKQQDVNLQQCAGLMSIYNMKEATKAQQVGWLGTTTVISTVVGFGCPPLGVGIAL